MYIIKYIFMIPALLFLYINYHVLSFDIYKYKPKIMQQFKCEQNRYFGLYFLYSCMYYSKKYILVSINKVKIYKKSLKQWQ